MLPRAQDSNDRLAAVLMWYAMNDKDIPDSVMKEKSRRWERMKWWGDS